VEEEAVDRTNNWNLQASGRGVITLTEEGLQWAVERR